MSTKRPLNNQKTQRPDKQRSNDSNRFTFQLFREGKSLETIAAMRELTVGTIEAHLNLFIKKGELDINELVSKEKVGFLLKEVQASENFAVAPIKEKLGDTYSYREIKAVISYWQWMKDAGIEI
ncbi:MAG: helix-turn-helix domain-containing protein [Chitinophagaceae bacterium]